VTESRLTTDTWVKVYRKLEHWEWYTDSQSVHLFVHLLIKANHKPKKWRGININPGQFVTSRDKLSAETGISQQSIRTILNHKLSAETGISQQSIRTILNRLKSTNEITIKSTSTYTLVNICNWGTYQTASTPINQPINQVSNQRSTSDQPAINQRLTTNKNEENEENVKNDKEETARGSFKSLADFLDTKTDGLWEKDLQVWRGIYGELKAKCKSADVDAVFEWATEKYYSAIGPARFFVDSAWPKILTNYKNRDYDPNRPSNILTNTLDAGQNWQQLADRKNPGL